MIGGVLRCLALLSARARRQWAGLVCLGFAAAALEAVGVACVLGLIRTLRSPAAADLPAWAWLTARPGASVAARAAGVALLFVAKNALLAVATYTQSRVAGNATAELATRALAAYLDAPYSFHLEQGSAALTRKLTYSVEQVGRVVFQAATALLTELLMAVAIVAVLVAAAPRITLLALVCLGLPCTLLVRLTRRAFGRWGEAERAHRQRVIAAVQHSLGGIKEVKAFDRDRFFVSRFARDQSALADIHSRYDTLAAAPRLIIETTLIGALLLATAALAGPQAAGADPVPLLGLFAYAAFRIIPSANRILVQWGTMRFAAPAVEELAADLRAARPPPAPIAEPPPAPLVLRDSIALEDVSFSYPGAGSPVLEGVRFEVRRGEAVGIVGASGAGKTTLVSLLVGLLAPTGGRIRVDGADLHPQLRAWRAAVGYVPQDPFLLEDTVRRNIAFGDPDAAIDEDRVRRALQAAQLQAFVAGLPGGLDAVIGERGARLSGGQRQRVAIARALYRQPQVLLFDEATSALDVQTEIELARAVERLEGLTRIVVAQRLGTLRGCDRLVVLRDGGVEAAGTLDDLRGRSETIRRMLSG